MRVSLIVNLRRKGLSLQRIRKVAKDLAQEPLRLDELCYIIVPIRGAARIAVSENFVIEWAVKSKSPVIVARIGEELENL